MVPAINAYLDVLVEDVLPDFGVDSGQRIVKEVDVGIGIQRPGEVHLAATDEGKIKNSQASILVTQPTLCLCPPDKVTPRSPISVMSPLLSSWTKD